MIGQTISHYKILDKLGEGGMGVVYRAEDTKLKRTVALKFLPPHLSASEQDKARFIQEAQAASAINHPNICTIHDIQDHDGSMFIVMEFVEGQTLKDLIGANRDSPLQMKRAIDIGIQIADGLAAAHEKGIVHRDIKPENIMIRKDGIAQIMDFGLAKLRGVSRLTKEGSTVGTAGYMSPEQVQGQDADHRSDIFSVGVLLYEMFTGQLPFKGVHETALMYEIVNVDAVPMSSVKPEVDQELERIVLECLEKDPNERTQSAKQIAVDLKRARRESGRQRVSRITAARPVYAGSPQGSGARILPADTVPSVVQRFAPAVAVAGLVCSGVFLTLWSPWNAEDRFYPGVARTQIEMESGFEAFTPDGIPNLAISPDGRLIAYGGVNRETGENAVFLRPLDSYKARELPGVANGGLAFSPDGEWLYSYGYPSGISRISVSGGAPVSVLAADGPRGMSIMPDGSIYIVPTLNGGVVRVHPGGDSTEVLTRPDRNLNEISHRFPSVLPGGKALIATVKYATTTSFDDADIVLFNLVTGERKILIKGGTAAIYVPTGHIVYAMGGSIYAVPFDAAALKTTGSTRELFLGGQLRTDSGVALFSFSQNGTLVYVPGGPAPKQQSIVDWLSLDGKLTPIIETPGAYGEVTVSPDGSRLALRVDAASNDIWTYDLRRKSLQRLTFGGGNHGGAVWSHDGKRVAYGAERDGKNHIYWRPWDGSGKEALLVGEEGYDLFPAEFSPDGKHLLYYRGLDGKYDVWAAALDSPDVKWPVLETVFEEQNVRISPNGKWVAYTSDESGNAETYITSFPRGEGRWQITHDGAGWHHWNKNGRELIYFTRNRKIMSVQIEDGPSPDPGPPRFLKDLAPAKLNITSSSYDPSSMRWAIIRQTAGLRRPTTINVVTGWFEELKKMVVEGGK